MSVEQVEEEHPGGLVSEGRGERLARDNVPSRGFILDLWVSLELGLNFSCKILVQFAFRCCFLANYSKTGQWR